MRVKVALLADFANVTREGKLNVIGMFDRLTTRAFPVVHPLMHLILQLEGAYAERGRSQKLEVTLEDPDGGRLFQINAEVVVTGGSPGRPATVHQILGVANLTFKKEGGHTFNIFVNGHLAHQVTLEVTGSTAPDQPRLPGT